MRLIDADALIEELKRKKKFFIDAWGSFNVMSVADKSRVDELDACIAEATNAPTIEPSKVDYRTDESANIGTEVNDLISRADAIDAVAEEWLSEASAESPYVNDNDIDRYRELAEELFADIPSAEAGWIPCSERMPSKSGTYLTTTAKGAVCTDHYYANSTDLSGRHWSYRGRREPIAWMPLPKPYKGGEDE